MEWNCEGIEKDDAGGDVATGNVKPFDTIVLVTGQIGAAGLIRFLERSRAGLSVHHVENAADLRSLSWDLLARSRLIGFATDVIVPAPILKSVGYGAYNFHPGSPAYPGWAPTSFAIYEGAETFGATAHEMMEKVDAGPIIGTELFPVDADVTVQQLAGRALIALVELFRRLGPALAQSPMRPPHLPIKWGRHKSTRASFAQMCEIPIDVGADELARRIRAFDVEHEKFPKPSIVLHGLRFNLDK